MINIANRLAREETEADKNEFIRGVVGLDKTNKGAKQAAIGFVAGYLLTKKLKKNG